MAVPDSILGTVKKMLGYEADIAFYDEDLLVHINNAFADMAQLGVGPAAGFFVDDESVVWSAFTTDPRLKNPAKSFVYFKVRLAFDPPATSFAIKAIEDQIAEITWRLNVQAQTTEVSP